MITQVWCSDARAVILRLAAMLVALHPAPAPLAFLTPTCHLNSACLHLTGRVQ